MGRWYLALFLSLAAHIFLFSKRVRTRAPLPPATVVWQKERAPTAPPHRPGAGRGGGGRAPGLSLRDLGFAKDGELLGGAGKDPRGSTGSKVLDRLRDGGVNDGLYQRLEAALIYPEELAEKKIQGMVSATVVFDESGHYRRDLSHLVADSAYLRVVVARLLRQVFREPLAVRYLRGRARKEVRCEFEFRLVGELTSHLLPFDGLASRSGAVDGTLRFQRQHRPAMVWKTGPVVWTPLGVGVDVEGLARDVAELPKPRKAEVDRLEKYRHDPEWDQPAR